MRAEKATVLRLRCDLSNTKITAVLKLVVTRDFSAQRFETQPSFSVFRNIFGKNVSVFSQAEICQNEM